MKKMIGFFAISILSLNAFAADGTKREATGKQWVSSIADKCSFYGGQSLSQFVLTYNLCTEYDEYSYIKVYGQGTFSKYFHKDEKVVGSDKILYVATEQTLSFNPSGTPDGSCTVTEGVQQGPAAPSSQPTVQSQCELSINTQSELAYARCNHQADTLRDQLKRQANDNPCLKQH